MVGGSVVRVLGVSDAAPKAMIEGGEYYSDMKSLTKKFNMLEGAIYWSGYDALFGKRHCL
jgi:hypothetical protein